jgi:hypothetical protein
MPLRNALLAALAISLLLSSTALANGAFELIGNVPKSIEVTAPESPGKWSFGLGPNEFSAGNIHVTTNSDSWSISLSANPDRMTSGTYSILNPIYARLGYIDNRCIVKNDIIGLSTTPEVLMEYNDYLDIGASDLDIPLNLTQYIIIGDFPTENYQTTITVTGTAS